MGYKSVCLTCRKAFSQGTDFTKFQREKLCPDCGQPMVFLNEKFQPPGRTDDKKWKVVEYMVSSGFDYRTVWENPSPGVYHELQLKFPETMNDAKEFVARYKNRQK